MSHDSYMCYTIILNNWLGYSNDYSLLLISWILGSPWKYIFRCLEGFTERFTWGQMTYPDVVTILQAGTTGWMKTKMWKDSKCLCIQTLDTMWPVLMRSIVDGTLQSWAKINLSFLKEWYLVSGILLKQKKIHLCCLSREFVSCSKHTLVNGERKSWDTCILELTTGIHSHH